MSKSYEEAKAKIQSRVISAKALRAVALQESDTQLPLWHETVRGLPNAMARGALFTCANARDERRVFKREVIITLQGFTISYTGEELRQDDQDVWLQVAHLARMHKLGDQVEVTGYALLTALGWGRAKGDYARLRASISRLREGAVWVRYAEGNEGTEASEGYSGNLIRSLKWSDAGSGERIKWRLFFEPEILALFQPNSYTRIEWSQRLKLSPLAKWLHSFYSTHAVPHPYKVETIHTLCGSQNNRMSSFRGSLKTALESLKAVGFLEAYTVDPKTDTVVVKRTPRRLALTENLRAA